MKIKRRKWVAIWWQCPKCGRQTAETMMSPGRYRRRRGEEECYSYKHDRCSMEIVEKRWYTTFVIEPGLSFTTIAGTLEKIGPFKVCDIVHKDHHAFRRWYWRRRREVDEQARLYHERERQIEAEWAERRKNETSDSDDYAWF